MAELVPELDALAEGLMLDGELVSFDVDGRPSFDRLGQRMLMRRRDIPVCFVAFVLRSLRERIEQRLAALAA
jgi:ATP-dependent DNA ligase